MPIAYEILQFARHHRIAIDHKRESRVDISSIMCSEEDLTFDQQDSIPQQHDASAVLSERLLVNGEAKLMLCDVINRSKVTLEADDNLEKNTSGALRVELPLLRTDHDHDVSSFKRKKAALKHGSRYFNQLGMDRHDNKTPTWQGSCEEVRGIQDRTQLSEKLILPGDSLNLLKETLYPERTHLSLSSGVSEDGQGRIFSIKSTSPPLLRISPDVTAQDEVPLLHSNLDSTEISCSLETELMVVEDDLVQADGPECDEERQAELSIGEWIISSFNLASSSPMNEFQAARTYLESPLLHCKTGEGDDIACASEEVSDLCHMWPATQSAPNDVEDDKIDEFLNAVVKAEAKILEDRLANERLLDTDTTLRVPIPSLDFSVENATCKSGELQARKRIEIEELSLPIAKSKLHNWSGSQNLDNDLIWSPISRTAVLMSIEENIGLEESLDDFVEPVMASQPSTMDVLVSETKHLRVLDVDEVLLSFVDEDSAHVQKLLRKRKLELDESQALGTALAHSKTYPGSLNEGPGPFELREQACEHAPDRTGVDLAKESGMHFDDLARLMSLHGHALKRKKSEQETHKHSSHESQTSVTASHGTMQNTRSLTNPLQFSLTGSSLPTHQIIVYVNTVAERRFLRYLRKFYAHDAIVERTPESSQIDYTRMNDLNSHGVIDSAEADVCISPNVGIIHTTLQKTMQKALPGQDKTTKLTSRIKAVAAFYEHLYVLVGAGSTYQQDSHLDERECKAMADLTAFASSLEDDVQVVFVAGQEPDLAKWVKGLESYSSLRANDTRLIDEETLWESFLCSLGMNVYAAQVVLSELKMDGNLHEKNNGLSTGLLCFVMMSHKQRRARLEHVLGGCKILDRIEKVLKMVWKD